MSIENISEGFGPHPIHRGYLDGKKRIDKSDQTEKKSKPDQVNISPDAKKLMMRDALVEQVKAALENVPDVRQERIQQTTQRLSYGYYADENVQKKVAGSLIEEQVELPNAGVLEQPETPPKVDPEMHIEKLKEVQQRVVDGYYDQMEVIETLVEKLMS